MGEAGEPDKLWATEHLHAENVAEQHESTQRILDEPLKQRNLSAFPPATVRNAPVRYLPILRALFLGNS